MAEQYFPANSGFYDSVSGDRLYSADQMTMPYRRLVADGVFAQKSGNPSTDLQVEAQSPAAMKVVVRAGNAMIGNKWFELGADCVITVPSNTNILPRIDSVIAQVDLRASGRMGQIVYRTGTPSSNPYANIPPINQVENVIEFRLANVYVGASATYIDVTNISDQRGSEDCPWVTSLIYQVDTSTLFNQWQAAYAKFYDDATEDLHDYMEAEQQAWEAWVQTLTDELTATTEVMTLQSRVTLSAASATVNIGIPSFDGEADALLVYVNGDIRPTTDYTISGQSVVFNSSLPLGTVVDFVDFKSVISANVETVVQMIRKLNDMIVAFTADTGWIKITTSQGVIGQQPEIRAFGNKVYLRGKVMGMVGTIGTLPAQFRPAKDFYFPASGYGPSIEINAACRITSSGTLEVLRISGSDPMGSSELSISTAYVAASGQSVGLVYSYKGSVQTYANLPVSPDAGDVWMVNTADAPHGIAAGDDVLWNGSDWEVLETAITSAEITEIVNALS